MDEMRKRNRQRMDYLPHRFKKLNARTRANENARDGTATTPRASSRERPEITLPTSKIDPGN